jgi:phosphate transport system permease protein
MKLLFYVFFLGFSALITAILLPIFIQGGQSVSLDFLLEQPSDLGRNGGIGPILVSTLLMNLSMIPVVLALGIPSALKLSQIALCNPRRHLFLRTVLDILASTPSIVFGLFGNAFFVVYLNLGYSILAGVLTLSLMILPLFIRLMEDAFADAAARYCSLCESLRISEVRTTFRILIPAVLPAVAAALVLGWTRAIGETAALLVTSGYSTRWPNTLLDSGRSLSIHIFDLSMNVPNGDAVAYRCALVLLLLTLFFSLASKVVMKAVFKWNLGTAL